MEILILIVGAAVSFLWLTVLTIFFWKAYTHYNSLTKDTHEKNLIPILDDLLQNVKKSQKDIDQLKDRCDTIEKEIVLHIQKIGLLRFNPFKDTGGDQSFILALLDKNDTGIVISSLYARSGTRWYAKRIVGGKAVDHQLSDEEQKVIKEAKTIAP